MDAFGRCASDVTCKLLLLLLLLLSRRQRLRFQMLAVDDAVLITPIFLSLGLNPPQILSVVLLTFPFSLLMSVHKYEWCALCSCKRGFKTLRLRLMRLLSILAYYPV